MVETTINQTRSVRIVTFTGSLDASQAVRLKTLFTSQTRPELFWVDLTAVTRIDLAAINALALGHKQHRLHIVPPACQKARNVFHLTKFNRSLSLKPALPVFHETIFYA